MKKNAIILTLGILVSKLFGFLREVTLASVYGAGMYTDTYKIANDIPIVIYGFVAAGIVTTFIPIYSRIKETKSEADADNYLSNILNIMGAVSIVLSIFGFVFAEQLIKIFGVGFDQQTAQTAVGFLRISIFSILFLSTKSMLEGYLQIKQRFLVTVISGFVLNIVIISSIILSGYTEQPILLAVGILASVALQTVMFIFISLKIGYRHKKTFNPGDPEVKNMLTMALPIIFGSSIDQVNKTIDNTIASTLGSGAISTLSYAVRISDSILGIFVSSISAVLYPSLAKQASQGLIEEMKETVRKTMNTINILIIPATFGLMILSKPVVAVVYSKLDDRAAMMTASALFFYTLGTVGYGLRQILVRTFYVLHDSKTPVYSSVITVGINIVLNLLLGPIMGVGGLALATSTSAIVSVILLYGSLRRKIGSLGTKAFLLTSSKIFVSSVLMGIAVYGTYHFVGGTTGMIASILVGVPVYVVAIYFMKIDEAEQIFDIVLKKLKFRN